MTQGYKITIPTQGNQKLEANLVLQIDIWFNSFKIGYRGLNSDSSQNYSLPCAL